MQDTSTTTTTNTSSSSYYFLISCDPIKPTQNELTAEMNLIEKYKIFDNGLDTIDERTKKKMKEGFLKLIPTVVGVKRVCVSFLL